MWFLSEFQEWYRQQEHATIIEDSPEYQTSEKDLVDEYFKTQRKCFTDESWDQFFEKYILPIYRKHILKDNPEIAKETVKNEQSTEQPTAT